MKTLQELTRPNIWKLKPYSSARDEYKGIAASVFLDANENPYNTPNNRYPDPLQWDLKKALGKLKGVAPENIFLGNGSDEAIDLMFRAFCEPCRDNVVAIEPTYGMYQVCAEINEVEYRKVLLDEAYNDFSDAPSFLKRLEEFPNLVVLQTFSKAWGCAAIRLGMAFASADIIGILTKIKYPYNVNQLTQQQAMEMLHRYYEIERWVDMLKEERNRMEKEFARLPCVKKVFPSNANFFLVKVTDAVKIYNYLVGEGIIVRNRHTVTLCGNCLRITVGTKMENETLLEALRKYGV